MAMQLRCTSCGSTSNPWNAPSFCLLAGIFAHRQPAVGQCGVCGAMTGSQNNQNQHHKKRCKAKGCHEKHYKHYCKICHDTNSNHKSANCPKNNNNNNNNPNNSINKPNKPNHHHHNKKKKCKVKDCNETHWKHFCRLCGDRDADHRSKNCSKGIQLCHGTQMQYVSSITKSGLMPSKTGRLGPGIYFTTEPNAKAIAKHRSGGKGRCVIYCSVNLGRMQNVHNGSDSQGSWRNNGYNSCKAMHPPWCGLPSFPEYCLADPKKCRIKKVELVDVVINGDINLPSAKIILRGKCKFTGKVIAGTLETKP